MIGQAVFSSLGSSFDRPATAILALSALLCCLCQLALFARVLWNGERSRTHARWGTWLAIVTPLAIGCQLVYVTHAARVAEIGSASVADQALRAVLLADAVECSYLGRAVA